MISSGYGITEGLGLFLSQKDSCRTMHSAVCVCVWGGWVPKVKVRDGIARE